MNRTSRSTVYDPIALMHNKLTLASTPFSIFTRFSYLVIEIYNLVEKKVAGKRCRNGFVTKRAFLISFYLYQLSAFVKIDATRLVPLDAIINSTSELQNI